MPSAVTDGTTKNKYFILKCISNELARPGFYLYNFRIEQRAVGTVFVFFYSNGVLTPSNT